MDDNKRRQSAEWALDRLQPTIDRLDAMSVHDVGYDKSAALQRNEAMLRARRAIDRGRFSAAYAAMERAASLLP
jgi:hypothetical protein